MRRRTLWPLALPLALGSALVAHQGAYGLTGGNERHLHGYLAHAPMFAAALVAGLLLALALRVRGRLHGRPAAWPYGLLPALVFVLQEVLERVAVGAPLPVHEPALLVGLALQLPLAVAAYLLARTLLACADTVAAVLSEPVRLALTALPPPPSAAAATSLAALARGYAGRAPPR